jgi:two-component system alkaline phosphatase synthesis response regulator PhoP
MAIKILIVEDDPTIRESLNALLTAKGYVISTAGDGAEAVAAARKENPQLMLLDVILPKMGGLDVCQILKKDPGTKEIKIVMITALGRMGDVESAFASGADDYLIKPFDSQRLFKKIEKVLNG